MKTTVLIVDDEKATTIGLKGVLEEPNVEVLTAVTLEDAKKLVGEREINVILSDIRLSGYNQTEGLELLEYAKEVNRETRVILMTGYGEPGTMQRAFDLGADYYFEKPVELKLLGNIIRDSSPAPNRKNRQR